jgi:CRISPR/Cas system Type II protein with McrA/HNH and RuvC-like nuclease domain
MDISALMKDLKQIDPKVRVSVKAKRDVEADLVIPVLRRTIKYDAAGRKVSDTITNLINNTDLEEIEKRGSARS